MSGDLKKRTKEFALNIIRLIRSMPNDRVSNTISGQLLRAGTAVAANYRAACRGRSHPEFISKIRVVEEEADESSFWLELMHDSGTFKSELSEMLLIESSELTAIFTSSGRTAKENRAKSKTAK